MVKIRMGKHKVSGTVKNTGMQAEIHCRPMQTRDFRRKCRKHNHYIIFGIDPELKP